MSPWLAERYVAVLPQTHRLAGKSSMRVRDLRGEPFILFARRMGPLAFRSDESVAGGAIRCRLATDPPAGREKFDARTGSSGRTFHSVCPPNGAAGVPI